MHDTTHPRETVEQLAEDFVARYRAGERPSIDDFAAAHPQHAAEIRDLFPALVMMEELAPSDAGSSSSSAGSLPPAPDTPLPERIGDYRILREIGRGGMGVVYEAEQESLGRRVALKVLPLHAGRDAKLLARFRRESRAAGQLHHTNIVPVFEVGQHADHFYYAMQFIPGQALDEILKELQRLRATGGSRSVAVAAPGPVTASLWAGDFAPAPILNQTEDYRPNADEAAVQTVCASAEATVSTSLSSASKLSAVETDYQLYCRNVARIGLQAAEALAYAHARGVIHRDVKPSNLLLDTAGIVWVSDFGLAKTQDHALTETGDIVGTVRYMAPERFRGECDARADVYALGLTLYELLTLRPAFDVADRLKLIDQIANLDPPRPRASEPRVPRDLETIVLTATDKDPRRRYPTADALATDLRHFAADEPIAARRIGPVERLGRWCRRNPALAAMMAAVVFVTVCGFGATVAQMQRAQLNEDRANQYAAHAFEKEEQARQDRDGTQKANDELRAAREELRQTLYPAHLNLIPAAWERDNVRRVIELLELQRPRIGDPSDLRGFEWDYWKRVAHPELAVRRLLIDATGMPLSINLSDDGSRAAAVTADGLRVWDVASGQVQLHRREVQRAFSESFFLSPDGRSVVLQNQSVGEPLGQRGGGLLAGPKPLLVIDVASGRDLLNVDIAPLVPRQSKFSPDGSRLAAVLFPPTVPLIGTRRNQPGQGDSYKLVVYDLATGQPTPAKVPDGWVFASPLAFLPDNRRLIVVGRKASGPTESRLAVLDTTTGALLENLPVTPKSARVFVSPDARRLALLDQPNAQQSAGVVKIVEAATGKELRSIPISGLFSQSGLGSQFRFTPDGKRLAGYEPTVSTVVNIWNVESGDEPYVIRGHTVPVSVAAFGQNGNRLVTLDRAGVVKTWDLTAPPAPAPVVVSDPLTSTFGAVTPDGRRSAIIQVDPARAGDENGRKRTLLVFDESGRKVQIPLSPTWSPVVGGSPGGHDRVYLSPDGTQVAALQVTERPPLVGQTTIMSTVGPWIIWDVATGQELRRIEVPAGHSTSGAIEFSPDGRSIATVLNNRTGTDVAFPRGRYLFVWDATTGEVLYRVPIPPITLPTDRPNADRWAFSADGQRLAISAASYGVCVFDRVNNAELRRYELPPDRSPSIVAFSTDGRRLAVGAAGGRRDNLGEVHLWDVEADDPPRVLAGHAGAVSDLAFSPDGRRLATCASVAGRRSEVKLWDPATGQEVLSLVGAVGESAVRFTADGHKLYIFGPNGRRTYDATPLSPEFEASDVADQLKPGATRAEVDAQLDKLALSPELKAKAAELARLSTTGGRGGRAGGAGTDLILYQPDRSEQEYRDALARAKQSLTTNPQDYVASRNYGGALYRLGRYEEAREALTHARDLAMRLNPGTARPVVSAFLAMTYHRLGQTEKAKEALAQLRRERPTDSSATQDFNAGALYAEAAALIERKK